MDIQVIGCYLTDDSGTLLLNQEEIDRSRFNGTLDPRQENANRIFFTLLFMDTPRIVTTIIDNEIDLSASSRRIRYFRYNMNRLMGTEKSLYDKWFEIFKKQIWGAYPHIDDVTRFERAQENARYFISVFTPLIQTEYTLSLRQICSLIGLFENRIEPATDDRFNELLNPLLAQTAKLLRKELGLEKARLTTDRDISLFTKGPKTEFFGETYSVNYSASFTALAESQGYHGIRYAVFVPKFVLDEGAKFYIPPIIDDTLLAFEYMDDMDSITWHYPQSMLLCINEQGTPDALLAKYAEQACGWSQLEACKCAYDTLKKNVDAAVKAKDLGLYRTLGNYLGRARCQIRDSMCDRPCPFGPGNVFKRKI